MTTIKPNFRGYGNVSVKANEVITATNTYIDPYIPNTTVNTTSGSFTTTLNNPADVVTKTITVAGSGSLTLSTQTSTYYLTSSNTPATFTFNKTQNTWSSSANAIPTTNRGTKLISGEFNNSQFGYKFASTRDGLYTVVGCPSYNKENGRAIIYKRTTTPDDYAFTEIQELVPYISSAISLFGSAVAISDDGKYIFVSAIADSNRRGGVFVFKISDSGDSWLLFQKLIIESTDYEYQGYALACSADGLTVVVGAPMSNNLNGYTIIWEYNSNAYNVYSSKNDGAFVSSYTIQVGFTCGYSVSITPDGNNVAVGSPTIRGNATLYDNGIVSVYTRTSGNQWSLQQSISDGYRYGYYVKLSDDGIYLIITYTGTILLTAGGYAILYKKTNDIWAIYSNNIVYPDFFAVGVADLYPSYMNADATILITGIIISVIESANVGSYRVYTRVGPVWTLAYDSPTVPIGHCVGILDNTSIANIPGSINEIWIANQNGGGVIDRYKITYEFLSEFRPPIDAIISPINGGKQAITVSLTNSGDHLVASSSLGGVSVAKVYKRNVGNYDLIQSISLPSPYSNYNVGIVGISGDGNIIYIYTKNGISVFSRNITDEFIYITSFPLPGILYDGRTKYRLVINTSGNVAVVGIARIDVVSYIVFKLTGSALSLADYIEGYTTNEFVSPSVSISNDGNTIAIGYMDDNKCDVHVYNGATWPLSVSLNAGGTLQGKSVDISGDGTVLAFSGNLTIWSYKYTSGVWNLQNSITLESSPLNVAGANIQLNNDGSILATSAFINLSVTQLDFGGYHPYEQNVWIYIFNGTTWSLYKKIYVSSDIPSANAFSDKSVAFGYHASMSDINGILAIGAPADLDLKGATWIYN